MSTDAYRQVIAASQRDRLDLFLATANRIGAPVGNVEKDFWVCWTLNSLYHERPAGEPRLLFKGGTSLSKGYGLIQRFSEDIDVTVFRDDLDEAASVEELEGLSNKKRRAKLEAIRDACRAYITGPLRDFLTAQLADITNGAGRVELDEADADGQTLLLWYPEVEPRDGAYVRPAIRLESGAKSALDPNRPITITPYVAEEAAGIDLTVADVTTIEATRTFWDKVVIAHGLRRWYERRGELRQEGQRVSRHYYDLHCLLGSESGKAALGDLDLGADCVRHARMFFDRPDYDLDSAVRGSFAIAPSPEMVDALARDYANTTAMIFGTPPSFDDILASARQIEQSINGK
ncbi:MAG: nucleotidyl transferase AbiEii/AbiGii toxin family protein [Mesorhizobium sp.]|uniref:nucleotidyl transferase AbiEii/AbiGii toxin family protein n=1 Tax=Mesorhizobium sp. TaxID=1871066 RepID=UPI000FE4F44C|nr:nucleotidyl transferase AbiEii/AbiGii toxin family protein [Mesorhizobium sp.]RWI18642.1 MAG: nucleotidyl transferase AbiEii/AbiGii toxin family protein [Mesorhizobium sp.]RWK93380.1 MAG: nucleotidyl transferase AbiEii/AbiGii toxin family protein [Mesorhizobium sp.]TJW41118.1 MAG: nucleotidyl transferase AbiEii/AbiGii toxin family protein [Mesorhizobium sp.]